MERARKIGFRAGLKPSEIWTLTPAEIFDYAEVMDEVRTEEVRHMVSLEYLNARLQRAEKMPPLSSLIEERKSPSLKSIVARLKAAPTFTPAG